MKKTVIVITGPTAVGKTSLAIELAKQFNTEIISADSRQCFKELSIAVAKPSAAELNNVPHYFINSHTIHEKVTAASFEKYALKIVAELFLKHEVVIMVGGTGLYIKSFCEGMDEIPETGEALRNQLHDQYNQFGIEWLQQHIRSNDPRFAKEGEMKNPQRMLRALEVVLSAGKSILYFRNTEKLKRNFKVIKIGLELPRDELYKQINLRIEKMMIDGLLEEAKTLYPFRQLNALQTVGYRELFDYFEEKISLEKTIEKIKQNSRHYAKRQLTWFKRDEEINWFHPSQINDILFYINNEIKKPDSI